MKKIYFAFALFAVSVFSYAVAAQILDDEMQEYPATVGDTAATPDDTDKSEALFNEMFSDHLDAENPANRPASFEDTAKEAVNAIKKSGVSLEKKQKAEKISPLEGDMLIGVTKGSFKVFQSASGRTKCSFGVTLKSNLNHDLRIMALRLVWQNRAFAFIFDNVSASSAAEKFIVTSGEFCYALAGVPDIDINLCKIKNARGEECAKRIKWDANLESPDPSASPY